LTNLEIQNIFVPMVIRLATIEALPSRLSAIALIAFCYSRSESQKEALRK